MKVPLANAAVTIISEETKLTLLCLEFAVDVWAKTVYKNYEIEPALLYVTVGSRGAAQFKPFTKAVQSDPNVVPELAHSLQTGPVFAFPILSPPAQKMSFFYFRRATDDLHTAAANAVLQQCSSDWVCDTRSVCSAFAEETC